MIYTLTKEKLMNPNSMVWEGYTQSGDCLTLVKPDDKIHVDKVTEIKEGYQVLVKRGIREYLITSPVKEIQVISDDEVTFETQTSIYRLTQKEEE